MRIENINVKLNKPNLQPKSEFELKRNRKPKSKIEIRNPKYKIRMQKNKFVVCGAAWPK